MKIESLTIRELLDKVNNEEGGFYLPHIQRPYVWGSRYESEKYICKLFDSIIRQYPIGTLIIWEAKKKIPYRRFLDDYKDGEVTKFVEENLFGIKNKFLVYDGQQRIQSIYSCLRYTFNNRILVYDLECALEIRTNTENEEEIEEEIEEILEANEFKFIDANDKEILEKNRNYVPMNLFTRLSEEEKVDYRSEILEKYQDEPKERRIEIEKRLEKLWDIFVVKSTNNINCYKPINYFLIESECEEKRINEIFQRLNTGGMILTNADLLLSKIKERDYSFETKLQSESQAIENLTNGYEIDYMDILQLLHFIIKGTTKLNPENMKKEDILQIIDEFDNVKESLESFFKLFIFDEFCINNSKIIGKKLTLFPLMLYVYKLNKLGINFRKVNTNNMKKYFILSQLNDWNTQTIVNNCCKLVYEEESTEFPIEKIEKYISEKTTRKVEIVPDDFEKDWWFSLKILMKSREFAFKDIGKRLKPELDHIFPLGLEGAPDDYEVNVIWNMQPVTGQINNDKKKMHPKEFFETEEGKKYIDKYDFIEKNLDDITWSDYRLFLSERKKKMIKFFNNTYNFNLSIEDKN